MEIKFLNVGCGDGIYIRFLGDDGLFHNVFIDGGTEKGDIYLTTLKKEIKALKERNENIDLWIITHIDNDHIGGLLRFIKDKVLFAQIDFTKTRFWFNYSNWDYDTGIKIDNFKSVKQGITLRNFLNKNALLSQFITDELQLVNFYGAKFSILSPNRENLEALIRKWKKAETKIVEKETSVHKASIQNDYAVKIADFELSEIELDKSPENASSIALILEYKNKKILLLADSHPLVLENSLLKLGYTKENKLSIEYMQVSHHGSKLNTTDGLLELIECNNFVVSGDGYNKYSLPNKKTFARIIRHNSPKPIRFFITQKNDLTASIFNVDDGTLNATLEFPMPGSNALVFNL